MWRMTMHNSASARTALVDFDVQQQFAGAVTIASQDVALEIRKANVGRCHIALADHGWRAEQVALPQADTYVAAVAVNVLPFPKLAACVDDVHAQSMRLRRARGGQGR